MTRIAADAGGVGVDAAEVLLTGRIEPPTQSRILRAGELMLELDGCDVRRISYRGIEVAQQIFVAIRDGVWNTIPGYVAEMSLTEPSTSSFEASFVSRHRRPPLGVDVEWQGRIEGDEQGRLRYSMDLLAHRALEYNRAGFNLYQGTRTYAGRPFRSSLAHHASEGRLPRDIGPQGFINRRFTGLFAPFDHLELSPRDDLWVIIDFEGDEFETEDQRNFGDATFKTYSTPLQRAAPLQLEAGGRIRQQLQIRVEDRRSATSVEDRGSRLEIRVGGATGRMMPPLGLGHAADGADLSEREVGRLAPLRPDHVRVELELRHGIEEASGKLAAAARAARSLAADLWVDVTTQATEQAALPALSRLLADARPQPRYVHLATSEVESPTEGASWEMLQALRGDLGERSPDTLVGAGAVAAFAALHHAPFDGDRAQSITFPSAPTAHRCDDDSVMENVDALGDTVVAARRALADRPLTVGPVTMVARHGPYPEGPRSAGDLPTGVDQRQVSLLAAAYTAGALAGFAAAGVEGITFYETVGWKGVTEGDAGTTMPERFHSQPGRVFPLWHVLADVAGWAGAEVLATDVAPEPLFTRTVSSLALRSPRGGIGIQVASLARCVQSVRIEGLPGSVAQVRMLDVTTAAAASEEPLAFRATSDARHLAEGALELRLEPYAVAWVSVSAR